MTTAGLERDLVASYAARRGDLDELLGPDASVREHWGYVASSLAHLGGTELERRRAEVRQLLRGDGATHRFPDLPERYDHDDRDDHDGAGLSSAGLDGAGLDGAGGSLVGAAVGRTAGPAPLRPWELDPVPMLVSSEEWAQVETGCAQRAELLDAVLVDLYGPRDLIRRGLLPPELVLGDERFLRPCDGQHLPGGRQLVVHAVDMVRGTDGALTVLADRTQVPWGAGFALENRRVLSRVLPSLFRDAGVHRLTSWFHALRRRLRAVAPPGVDDPRVVILTAGPSDPTYFEHAFLASYLGFTLVEGSDLTVHEQRVWLRTTRGLEPVDVILRRVDDAACDPLELRPDSLDGVTGLVHAVRCGTVTVVNPLGSGILENPALHAFLPDVAQHLLGRPLDLPMVPTWWCGRPGDRAFVTANLARLVLKPTDPRYGRAVMGPELTREQLATWRARLQAAPHRWVGQEVLPASTSPTLVDGRLAAHRVSVRAFLVARDDSYDAMPGALTLVTPRRVRGAEGEHGAAKDTWVLSSEPEERRSAHLEPATRSVHDVTGSLTSRAAENMFWLGRHAERIEGTVRALRTILGRLDVRLGLTDGTLPPIDAAATGGARPSPSAAALRVLLSALTHATATFPGFATGTPDVEQELLELVFDDTRPGTVASNVQLLVAAAQPVADLVGADTFLVVNGIEQEWDAVRTYHQHDLVTAVTATGALQQALLGLVGVTSESMVRAPDWYFLDLGRRLERALQLVTLLRATLVSVRAEEVEATVADGVLEITVSSLTYRRRYGSALRVEDVLDLLLTDPANPRSALFQLERVRDDLEHLPIPAGLHHHHLPRRAALALEAATAVRLADTRELAVVDAASAQRPVLDALLARLYDLLSGVVEAIAETSFTHLPGRQLLAGARPAAGT